MGAEILTELQIKGSVSISYPDKLVDLALKHGAQELVDEFAPADAVEFHLRAGDRWHSKCPNDELTLRDTGLVQRRDVELNTAFKGAGVLNQLLEAFDVHHRHGGRRFTVGNVNVEFGAQAIVGNVETTPRQEPRIEEAGAKANKHKPRAA